MTGAKDFTMQKREIIFNISQNFKIIKVLGEGAYGVVVLAVHIPTGTNVAIKKIVPFHKLLFCLRTLREIKLLSKFRNHENIIQLYDVQKPLDFEHFNEVYLIQEYMPTDLHRVIVNEHLTNDHIRYLIYQVLRGLKMMHLAHVIHRDLKPSNILIDGNCDLKICDLGLSRVVLDDAVEGFTEMTEYVATRWYRAPEIMLTLSQYSSAVDMWSVGCILAELFRGKPLLPGKDYRHQVLLVMQFLGSPTAGDLAYITSPRTLAYMRSLPRFEAVDFSRAFPQCDPQGLDLMSRLLMFSPSKRLTVEQALAHPYVALYHDLDDEPTLAPVQEQDFIFDTHRNHNLLDLKRELFSTVLTLNS
jgi:mitogen-activated protein kinase 1/3